MTRSPCASCSRELPAACGDCVMGLLLSLVNGLPVPTWGWSRLMSLVCGGLCSPLFGRVSMYFTGGVVVVRSELVVARWLMREALRLSFVDRDVPMMWGVVQHALQELTMRQGDWDRDLGPWL